jgi:hypothetical protein
MAYLGFDVGSWSTSPWLGLGVAGQLAGVWVWFVLGRAAFGVRADPFSRAVGSAGFAAVGVALVASPVTVAVWLIHPRLVLVPAALVVAVLAAVVAGEWSHVMRVAFLDPARVRAVGSRVSQALSAEQRRHVEQRAAWWALDSPWEPRQAIQSRADRAVRAIGRDAGAADVMVLAGIVGVALSGLVFALGSGWRFGVPGVGLAVAGLSMLTFAWMDQRRANAPGGCAWVPGIPPEAAAGDGRCPTCQVGQPVHLLVHAGGARETVCRDCVPDGYVWIPGRPPEATTL